MLNLYKYSNQSNTKQNNGVVKSNAIGDFLRIDNGWESGWKMKDWYVLQNIVEQSSHLSSSSRGKYRNYSIRVSKLKRLRRNMTKVYYS